MLVVIDSGSTKSDWLIDIGGGNVYETTSAGINPLFNSSEQILKIIQANPRFEKFKNEKLEIYFYGAGVSDLKMAQTVEEGFKLYFTNIQISVTNDIVGAALSCCGNETGIACILGTGSNACLFDGHKCKTITPSMGYILGDEGSGSNIGKTLLRDFFYNKMPADLSDLFNLQFQPERISVLHEVYRKPNANVYLASFAVFAGKNKAHPYIQQLIKKTFSEFADCYIRTIPDFEKTTVHFVGSIAHTFQDEMKAVAKNLNFTTGRFVKRPVDGLMKFHLS